MEYKQMTSNKKYIKKAYIVTTLIKIIVEISEYKNKYWRNNTSQD